MESLTVDGYELPLDRSYHPRDGLWVRVEGGLCRIGMDQLGQETCGDLSRLALVDAGATVACGAEIGSLEAQKFVGTLRAPISGTVVEVNSAILAEPHLINRDPYEEGWIAVVRPDDRLEGELAGLVAGDAVGPWFERRLRECRTMGILAEAE